MSKKSFAFAGTMRFFMSTSLLWAGVLQPHILVAQTDSLKKVNLLKAVEIKAYRLSEQSKSATPLQVLSADELKQMNSLSVADAIRYFSGVQLKDYGGIGGLKTVNVRSLGSNHTAVFLDGVQVGNAQNGQVDLGKFSLGNLEEIALYSGQKPVLLMPAKAYASASAIYLKTKVPVFEANKTSNLDASLKWGSYGLVGPALTYQYQIDSNLAASVNTEYMHAHGRYQFRYTNGVFDTTAVRNNGDISQFRAQAALFGKLKNGKWNAQAYSFLSERGLPGAIVANRFDSNQRLWDRNYFVQGGFEKQVSDRFAVLVNAKYAADYQRYLDPTYIGLDGFLDNRFQANEAYVSVAATYQLGKVLTVGYGSDYQYQQLDANIYRFAFPERNTFLNVLSAAFSLNGLNIQANLLSTTVNDRVEVYSSAGHKQVFSPSVLLSWKVFKDQDIRLRAFYKDIFRMPTFNDLYYTFVGNTLLNPEYAQQYNLGFTYFKNFNQQKIQFIDLQADAYYNRVKDKIIAQPGANLFRWVMYNIGLVDVRGLEINAKLGFEVLPALLLQTGFSYTYQKAIDISPKQEGYDGGQIPYVPKNSGSFLARLAYNNWHANYSFIYTGFRYNQKANIIYNYMEPWYTHDVAIGYDLQLKQQKLGVNVAVNNVLNQYYDVIPNFPMPGRNFRLTLNYNL